MKPVLHGRQPGSRNYTKEFREAVAVEANDPNRSIAEVARAHSLNAIWSRNGEEAYSIRNLHRRYQTSRCYRLMWAICLRKTSHITLCRKRRTCRRARRCRQAVKSRSRSANDVFVSAACRTSSPNATDLKARVLTTNSGPDEGTCSLDLLEAASEAFALTLPQARSVIKEVATVTATWRDAEGRRSPFVRDQPHGQRTRHDDLKRALAL